MPDPGGGIFSGRCQSQQRCSEADVSAGSLFFISSQFLEVPYEDGKRDQTVTGAHNLLKTLTPCTLWQLGSGRKSWGSGKKTQPFVLSGSAETIKFGLTMRQNIPNYFCFSLRKTKYIASITNAAVRMARVIQRIFPGSHAQYCFQILQSYHTNIFVLLLA